MSNTKIVAFGDSVTAGTSAKLDVFHDCFQFETTTPNKVRETQTWWSILERLLSDWLADGVEVVCAGVAGDTAESGLGGTTAVGLYPSGASAAGVPDMAGTIYEWCSNTFSDPKDASCTATDQRRRALRGGSWYATKDYARCRHRDGEYPGDRRDGIGFRVLCSSPRVDR